MSNQSHSKRIHVFTADLLPFPGCARSAGGDRGMQLISALRNAGHVVTFSMPLVTHLAKTQLEPVLSRLTDQERWFCENYLDPTIVLSRVNPDIAIFCSLNLFLEVRCHARDTIYIMDLHGPIHFESLFMGATDAAAAMRNGQLLELESQKVSEALRNADFIITSSHRQKYFWVAYCSVAGFGFEDLNITVCPIGYEAPTLPRKTSHHLSVVYAGGFYPWQEPDNFLKVTASLLDNIQGAALHIFGGPHSGLPNEARVDSLIRDLQKHQCVIYHGYQPIEVLMAQLSSAWCAVDLMKQHLERELAISGRTVSFLWSGTPVIHDQFSSLSSLIERYGAGWVVSKGDTATLERIFWELVEGGRPLVAKLSHNALRLAKEELDIFKNMAPLVQLCAGNLEKRKKAIRVEERVPKTFESDREGSRITEFRQTISSLQKEISDLRQSYSWRITSPLRKIAGSLMKLRTD